MNPIPKSTLLAIPFVLGICLFVLTGCQYGGGAEVGALPPHVKVTSNPPPPPPEPEPPPEPLEPHIIEKDLVIYADNKELMCDNWVRHNVPNDYPREYDEHCSPEPAVPVLSPVVGQARSLTGAADCPECVECPPQKDCSHSQSRARKLAQELDDVRGEKDRWKSFVCDMPSTEATLDGKHDHHTGNDKMRAQGKYMRDHLGMLEECSR